jgi:hypothetical protein
MIFLNLSFRHDFFYFLKIIDKKKEKESETRL